jgi:AcrR family transcriptional regulator
MQRKDRAQMKSELRRQQIVEAVIRVVAQGGAASLTTRKVAHESGANLATINELFGGKDLLLLAALNSVTESMLGALPVVDGSDGLRPVLANTLSSLCRLIDADYSPPLVRCELVLYLERRPGAAAGARLQGALLVEALVERFSQALQASIVPVSGAAMAGLVLTVIDGLALQRSVESPEAWVFTRAQAIRAILATVAEDWPGAFPAHGNGNGIHIERRLRPANPERVAAFAGV